MASADCSDASKHEVGIFEALRAYRDKRATRKKGARPRVSLNISGDCVTDVRPGPFRVVHRATVREGVERSSNKVGILQAGTSAIVVECGANQRGQTRLRLQSPLAGWVSLRALSGQQLLLDEASYATSKFNVPSECEVKEAMVSWLQANPNTTFSAWLGSTDIFGEEKACIAVGCRWQPVFEALQMQEDERLIGQASSAFLNVAAAHLEDNDGEKTSMSEHATAGRGGSQETLNAPGTPCTPVAPLSVSQYLCVPDQELAQLATAGRLNPEQLENSVLAMAEEHEPTALLDVPIAYSAINDSDGVQILKRTGSMTCPDPWCPEPSALSVDGPCSWSDTQSAMDSAKAPHRPSRVNEPGSGPVSGVCSPIHSSKDAISLGAFGSTQVAQSATWFPSLFGKLELDAPISTADTQQTHLTLNSQAQVDSLPKSDWEQIHFDEPDSAELEAQAEEDWELIDDE